MTSSFGADHRLYYFHSSLIISDFFHSLSDRGNFDILCVINFFFIKKPLGFI